MRSLALLLFALLSAGFAPAPLPRPPKSDLKALQGAWVSVSDRTDGRLATPFGLRLVITGNVFQFWVGEGKADGWTATLDPKQRPAAADLRRLGSDRVEIRARYAVEGNILTFAWILDGTRPDDLSGRTGRIIVFRR